MHPTLLLICSGIEAGFKSYLNHDGLTLDELRNDYGHDLQKLQAEVLRRSTPAIAKIAEEVTAGINLVNDHYMNKRFNYREIGSATYPKPGLMCRWIGTHLAEIKPLVLPDA